MKNLSLLLFALAMAPACGESPATQPSAPDAQTAGGIDAAAPAQGAGEWFPDAAEPSAVDAASQAEPGASMPDDATVDAGLIDPACRGDVVLETEADAAAIAQCSALGGSLTITGEGLSSVDLPLLASIAGDLFVKDSALRDFELPALELLGGGLSVYRNQLLERVALPALTRSRGGITFGGSTSTAEDLQPALTAIELPALLEIGDDTRLHEMYGTLSIQANGALTALQLPALRRVTDRITIYSNATLASIDLPELKSVGFEIEIGGNDMLAAVRMPSLIETDGRYIKIAGKALTGFDLSALADVAGSLQIESDAALTVIDLPRLQVVGEVLRIGPTAATRIGLPLLREVGTLIVSRNAQLESFELPALEVIAPTWIPIFDDSEPGGVYVGPNPVLNNLDLPKLAKVGNDFVVQGNPMLSRLNLPVVAWVGDDFELSDSALTQLAAPELTWVGISFRLGEELHGTGDFTLSANAALTQLQLPGLTRVLGNLRVSENPVLPTCEAQALAAQLSSPAQTVAIESNAGTCP